MVVCASPVQGANHFRGFQKGFAEMKLCVLAHIQQVVKIYQKVLRGIKFPVLTTDNAV
jgi:hypothetical protein